MTVADKRALEEWASIPKLVRGLVEGLDDAQLDLRREGCPLSRRETAHHIVEANVVAAGIVIAGLGSPGCVFDWSWMLPFGPWMPRLAYDRKPLAPSLALLDAVNAYIRAQIEPLADGLQRTVRLRDAPAAELRSSTVAEVLVAEAVHAREHVKEWTGGG